MGTAFAVLHITRRHKASKEDITYINRTAEYKYHLFYFMPYNAMIKWPIFNRMYLKQKYRTICIKFVGIGKFVKNMSHI